MLGDKGCDSDWSRAALSARGITPCIPSKSNRKGQYHYDKVVYKKRTWSRNRSPKSKTGGASTPAMTAGRAPSCQQTAINRFVAEHNDKPKPFTWTADPNKIIAAVKRGHQASDSIH